MAKRTRQNIEEDDDAQISRPRSWKRMRYNTVDRISVLSDELVVRILSYLDIGSLMRCQRLSHRFASLTTDDQLWKSAYYNKFVLPRAIRIPGVKSSSLQYSSKASKWLSDDYLVKAGGLTNWKTQYKLRHNWTTGSSKLTTIDIDSDHAHHETLFRVRGNVVISADEVNGLGAWTVHGSVKASSLYYKFPRNQGRHLVPSALSINSEDDPDGPVNIAVGFFCGSWSIYRFEGFRKGFSCIFESSPTPGGWVATIEYASPYLAIINKDNVLSIYSWASGSKPSDHIMASPKRITCISSKNPLRNLSLSLRLHQTSMVAALAYSSFNAFTGWEVSIQELRVHRQSEVVTSRLTNASRGGFIPLHGSQSATSSLLYEYRKLRSPLYGRSTGPPSLSYSHPYLVEAHSNNTLSFYLVQSSDETLKIGPCHRLSGHTSAVLHAQVGDRGRVVSIGAGGEIRVWELEDLLASPGNMDSIATSVRVVPQDHFSKYGPPIFERPMNQRVAGFDQEKIVVARRESPDSGSMLLIHDFS